MIISILSSKDSAEMVDALADKAHAIKKELERSGIKVCDKNAVLRCCVSFGV